MVFPAVIVVGATGFYMTRAGGPSYIEAKVQKGELIQEVSASGDVEPPVTLDLHFKTGGKLAELNVEAGDRVDAGQVLARLDAGDLEVQLDQADEGVAVAQAQLNKLLAGSSSEDIEIYKTAVNNAQNNLDNLQRVQDIAVQSSIDVLRDAYSKADDSVRNRADRLFEDPTSRSPSFGITIDYGSSQYPIKPKNTDDELEINAERVEIEGILNDWEILIADPDSIKENSQSAINDAGANFQMIQTFLNNVALVINSYNSSELADDAAFQGYRTDIATARTNVGAAITSIAAAKGSLESAAANVTTAEGMLKTAQSQLALMVAPTRQSDAQVYMSLIGQAQAVRRQIEKQIEDLTIVSSEAGMVAQTNGDVGELMNLSVSVVSMIPEGFLRVKLNVSENNIVDVRVGQKVDITLDAFGDGHHFYGKVVSIDPVGTLISGAVYYKTTVDFDEVDERIRPDMTVNASIETVVHQDSIYIPISALQTIAGRKSVQILRDGVPVEREVQTGIENSEGMIEIISGLEVGQTIILGEKQ